MGETVDLTARKLQFGCISGFSILTPQTWLYSILILVKMYLQS